MFIETCDASAQDHQVLADKMLAEVVQSLKMVEQQKEELRRKVNQRAVSIKWFSHTDAD